VNLNYGSLFQDWEIGIAKRLINKFKKKYECLKNEDFEDLLQECLSEWSSAKKGYDPKHKVPQKTYMGRVVRNTLVNIVREKESDKRKVEYVSVSLNEPLEDVKDSPALIDTIPGSSNEPLDISLKSELNEKLSNVLQKLTPEQRKLCKLLKKEDLNINKASKYFLKHRTSIYDEVKRIRKVFRKEGLEDYLEFFKKNPYKSKKITNK